MKLDELGSRICIMGPSNSGKSTLAEAIGRAKGLEVVHLDQLHHIPHTDWVPRPPDEFAALHDAAIARVGWVDRRQLLAAASAKAGKSDRIHPSRRSHHDQPVPLSSALLL